MTRPGLDIILPSSGFVPIMFFPLRSCFLHARSTVFPSRLQFLSFCSILLPFNVISFIVAVFVTFSFRSLLFCTRPILAGRAAVRRSSRAAPTSRLRGISACMDHWRQLWRPAPTSPRLMMIHRRPATIRLPPVLAPPIVMISFLPAAAPRSWPLPLPGAPPPLTKTLSSFICRIETDKTTQSVACSAIGDGRKMRESLGCLSVAFCAAFSRLHGSLTPSFSLLRCSFSIIQGLMLIAASREGS